MLIRPLLVLRPLSDEQLIEQLKSLVRRERVITLAVLLRLVEVERRGLHLRRYSSLFAYCTDRLGYSPSAAGRRIRAARCLRDFPRVYSMLLEGRINLTTLCIVARVMTNENESELLARVDGKPQAEVERVVAALSGPVKPRDSIRPVRLRSSGGGRSGVGSGIGVGSGVGVGSDSVSSGSGALGSGSSSSGDGATTRLERTIQDFRACPRSETCHAPDPSHVVVSPSVSANHRDSFDGSINSAVEGSADCFVKGSVDSPVDYPAGYPADPVGGPAGSLVNGLIKRSLDSFVGSRADDSGDMPAEHSVDAAEGSLGSDAPSRGASNAPSPAVLASGSETPLSYRIQITVDASFVTKLERVRAIVSRGRPNVSFSEVLERALDEFLKRNDPQERMARRQQRTGGRRPVPETMTPNETMGAPTVDPSLQPMSAVEVTPRETPSVDNGPHSMPSVAVSPQSAMAKGRRVGDEGSAKAGKPPHREGDVRPSDTRRGQREARPATAARGRSIPAALRDEVLCRDGGQCTYVGPEGRCPETRGLQIDHIDPVVLGGLTELKNLRAICGPHNQSEADRVLGKDFMELRRRRTPAPGVSAPVRLQPGDQFTSST